MFINPASDNKRSEGSKSKKINKRTGKGINEVSENDYEGFFDVLMNSEIEITEKELKEMIDRILSNGNSFIRSPTEWNLKKYRDSIKDYLKRIEKKLYKIKEEMGLEADYPRLHIIAEIVDEKITNVTEAVLKKEKDTLFYASKVEEINGLLIDLYR